MHALMYLNRVAPMLNGNKFVPVLNIKRFVPNCVKICMHVKFKQICTNVERLTFCLTGLDSTKEVKLMLIQYKQSSRIQTK